MFARVTIAGLAVTVLIVASVSLAGDITAALAQQAQPPKGPAQPPRQSARPMTQAASQSAPATQPEQGKLVVQFGGSASRSGPTPEELKALARVAEEWVKNNPPGKTVAVEKPVVKTNGDPKVPPEERETGGLPAPTWVAKHGKVQPAVRDALEAQRKLIETNPMADYQADRPIGFQGLAYVDIYLRHHVRAKPESKENQAAIKEVEDRLLSSLTAAELSVYFVFENTAGVVGYVDEAGLDKLTRDPDVIGVGLDDQARPQERRIVRESNEIGPRSRGATKQIGKIGSDVYEELEKSEDGWVPVTLSLNDPPPEERGPDSDRDAVTRRMEDRVLSCLTAQDFRARCRSVLSGRVNRAGLAKLDANADVLGVGLDYAFRVQLKSPPTRIEGGR